MKKKIIIVAVVIFVSLGLLSISKIVQDKYLSKKNVPIEQKANSTLAKEVSVKANDKQDAKPIIEKPEAKSIIEKSQEKPIVQSKTVTDETSVVKNKTEEKVPQVKPNITENVVVPKQVTKEIVKEVIKKAPEPKKQANLVIKDNISGKMILSINVSTENKTVGEITLSELNNRGINYSSSGRGETVYITMINNLKARGKGPLSGWCYYVNGTKPGVSCGAYKLKSSDVVEWKYLEDAINN